MKKKIDRKLANKIKQWEKLKREGMAWIQFRDETSNAVSSDGRCWAKEKQHDGN